MCTFLYALLCLSIAIIPMGLFCADETFYGSIFMRSTNYIVVAGYTMSIKFSKSGQINKLIYGDFRFESTDIMECWEKIKNETSLKLIPKDNIFIKIFYLKEFNTEIPFEENLRIKEFDTTFAKQFLNIKNVTHTEERSIRQRNIYGWAYENIDLKYGIVQNITKIILSEDTLFISFLPSAHKTLSDSMTYNVQYNSNEYTVVANEYTCASPIEATYFMYENLIKNSNKMDAIEHPCMPTNSFITFNPSKVQRACCVTNFVFDSSVKFIGLFNELKCQSLLHAAFIRKKVISDDRKIVNFADMNLPLGINSNNKLKIKTKWFGRQKNEIKIKKFLIKRKKNSCGPDPLNKLRSILLIKNKCFQSVYLEYLLLNIVGFSGDNVFLENEFEWEIPFKLYIFADPRFGLTFTTESTFSLSTTAISDVNKSTGSPHLVVSNIIINMVIFVILFTGLLLYIYFVEYLPKEDDL